MVACDGNTKKICDIVSTRLGRTFTSKQLHNFRNARLGGASAETSMKILLDRFTKLDGSNTLVVLDQDDHTCGVIMQSRIQRDLFQQYGDSLILDWTHDTNNVGFYFGELVRDFVWDDR